MIGKLQNQIAYLTDNLIKQTKRANQAEEKSEQDRIKFMGEVAYLQNLLSTKMTPPEPKASEPMLPAKKVTDQLNYLVSIIKAQNEKIECLQSSMG